MTGVDKKAEKDRLINEIKQFRNDTESGINLTLLTSEGHYVNCMLFVDRVMGRIIIRRDAAILHDSSIVDVQGVYNHFEAFSIWSPHMKGYNAYQRLRPHDWHCCIVIADCTENPNSMQNICLLAPDAARRDHVISMLKILVDWYKRHPGRMDKEMWKVEKERVHSMLKSFSREAAGGLACKVLEKSTGTHVVANFSLNRASKIVTVQLEYCSKKLIVSLADVEGVYSYHDLMEELPDPEIGQGVIKENHNKAVFVHHRAQDLPEPWICLLLHDEADVERFVTCLRILRMHIQMKEASLSQDVVYSL